MIFAFALAGIVTAGLLVYRVLAHHAGRILTRQWIREVWGKA